MDTVLDVLFFYEGTFLEILILDVPFHEVYMRVFALFVSLVFALVVGKHISNINEGKLENPTFRIVSNCCRVPTLYSHLISMMINLESDIPKTDLEKTLSEFSNIPKDMKLPSAQEKPIKIMFEKDRPQPAIDFPIPYDKKSGMVIKLGRLEKNGKTLKLFILFNNTVRGAAGTSVLNAELALKSGLIGR